MAQKKSFVHRIEPEKFAALEEWAADEFRNTNGQIEWIIDQTLRKSRRLKKLTTKEKGAQNHEDHEG